MSQFLSIFDSIEAVHHIRFKLSVSLECKTYRNELLLFKVLLQTIYGWSRCN